MTCSRSGIIGLFHKRNLGNKRRWPGGKRQTRNSKPDIYLIFIPKGKTQIDLRVDENVQVSNPPVGYNVGGHISATSWLASGHSIIFSVPKEHRAKRLAIFVSFKYEWETAERDEGSKEPEPQVYFRAADLPPNVVEK